MCLFLSLTNDMSQLVEHKVSQQVVLEICTLPSHYRYSLELLVCNPCLRTRMINYSNAIDVKLGLLNNFHYIYIFCQVSPYCKHISLRTEIFNSRFCIKVTIHLHING